MLRSRLRFVLLLGVATTAVIAVTGSQAGSGPGFKTSRPALLALGAGAPADSSVEPLISVGDSCRAAIGSKQFPMESLSIRAAKGASTST